ncbi:hypothetical protein KY339_05800 [Candidatus Woesearchaeota archaeon]|nr:hypothetical protein [Candidatus Woesearchaeota archaeon]
MATINDLKKNMEKVLALVEYYSSQKMSKEKKEYARDHLLSLIKGNKELIKKIELKEKI